MIYQLAVFERWIKEVINPETIKDITDKELKEHINFANCEKDRICSYFRDKAIGKRPKPTRQFIHTHQDTIATLIAVLMGYIKETKSLSPAIENFYRNICLILDDLIHFIQRHLPTYFDVEANITALNADLSKKYLTKALEELQYIAELPSIDTALYSMVVRPIRQFVNEDKPINYRELSYLKELAHSLKQLTYLDVNADINCELHLILLQLNFNHSRYVLHYCYWLDAQVIQFSDRIKRLDELSKHIMTIERMEYNPGLVYNPSLPPLKEQLLRTIKATYQYLLTEAKPVNHVVIGQIEKGHPPKAKIRLAISVTVLAVIIKILMKARIILNKNRSEVFRIIADNFATMKSENISEGSMKGKFNKPPASACLGAKNLLDRMRDYLREI